MKSIIVQTQIEWFVFRLYLKLLRRNFIKYAVPTTTVYLYSLFRISVPAKPAYFICRYIDDVADGDLELSKEYRDYNHFFSSLIEVCDGPKPGSTILEQLLNRAILSFPPHQHIEVRELFREFICSMQKETERRLSRQTFNSNEILALYDDTFGAVIKITCIGTGAVLSPEIISKLARLQGRIYAIDDLYDDYRVGLINIPKEILIQSEFEMIGENTVLKAWIEHEYRECQAYAADLLSLKLPGKAQTLVNLGVRPIAKRINRHLASLVERSESRLHY